MVMLSLWGEKLLFFFDLIEERGSFFNKASRAPLSFALYAHSVPKLCVKVLNTKNFVLIFCPPLIHLHSLHPPSVLLPPILILKTLLFLSFLTRLFFSFFFFFFFFLLSSFSKPKGKNHPPLYPDLILVCCLENRRPLSFATQCTFFETPPLPI